MQEVSEKKSLTLKNNFHEFKILEHVESTPLLTNRILARKLGCSVKLAHELLGKMVARGCFHVKKIHSRRWDYFLTPKGIAEKMRLTYEFMQFSMHFYKDARRKSSQLCRNLAESGVKQVAFLGAGELAEIVYLGVKEWNLELVDVFDDTAKKLLNHKTKKVEKLKYSSAQAMIVCTYNPQKPMDKDFMPENIKVNIPIYNVFGEKLVDTSTSR
ncbi:MAG: winged helix-turn-helix domain-containing protein [Victivallaceae bacterium]|nr:winged helix-turn-helix domain-containing protein [Victivallaceae bacterium]